MAEEQRETPGGGEPEGVERVDDAATPTPEADAPGDEVIDASQAAERAIEDASQSVAALDEGDDQPGGMSDSVGLNLPELGVSSAGAGVEGIDLLSDVNVNVRIELGRTEMLVEDVLRLGEGAVVELDKLAGDPVDIFVNDRPVARGEVLVLNDNFCVRVNEILSPPSGGDEKHGA